MPKRLLAWWPRLPSGAPRQEPLTHPAEAQSLLAAHVAGLRARGHAALKAMADDPATLRHQDVVRGESGLEYLIETEVTYDDASREDLRVWGTVYEEHFHARRVGGDFIIARDGSFVGE